MKKKNELKQLLFNRGADAAIRIGLNIPDTYICPICCVGFTKSALQSKQLLLEHVPPRAVGGKPLVLTCNRCNTVATSRAESELKKREDIAGFLEALHGAVPPAKEWCRISLGSSSVNAETQIQNGKTIVYLDPKHNSPIDYQAFIDSLKSASPTDFSLNLAIAKGYYYSQSNAAELKTAFLFAFAYLGYRFALDPWLSIVRETILDPTKQLIPYYWHANTPQISKGMWQAIGEISSLIISLGRSLIFLPWGKDRMHYYSVLSDLITKKASLSYRLTKITELPNRMIMFWDFK